MSYDEYDYRLSKRPRKGLPAKAAAERSSEGPSETEATSLPFSFGNAIERLKNGEKVARKGWNGKGMYLWLEKGSHDFGTDAVQSYIGGVRCTLFEKGDKGTSTRMPHICMRAADGSTVTGWLASQTDMLAIDWVTA